MTHTLNIALVFVLQTAVIFNKTPPVGLEPAISAAPAEKKPSKKSASTMERRVRFSEEQPVIIERNKSYDEYENASEIYPTSPVEKDPEVFYPPSREGVENALRGKNAGVHVRAGGGDTYTPSNLATYTPRWTAESAAPAVNSDYGRPPPVLPDDVDDSRYNSGFSNYSDDEKKRTETTHCRSPFKIRSYP